MNTPKPRVQLEELTSGDLIYTPYVHSQAPKDTVKNLWTLEQGQGVISRGGHYGVIRRHQTDTRPSGKKRVTAVVVAFVPEWSDGSPDDPRIVTDLWPEGYAYNNSKNKYDVVQLAGECPF